MKAKEAISTIYPNLGYWLMLFVFAAFAGFYVTYFSKLFDAFPSIVHIHFAFMSTWMVLAITQPLIIKYKKFALHKKLGKVSYLLLPLVLITSFLMMRHSYQNQLDLLIANIGAGLESMTFEEGLILLGSYQAIGFVYLIWLATFYSLAIYNKKNPRIHARYMIATVLTFIGPTLDRILYYLFDIPFILPGIPAEYASFFLIDLLLSYLIIRDVRKGKNFTPFTYALGIYILFQVLYTLIPNTTPFSNFVNFLLN